MPRLSEAGRHGPVAQLNRRRHTGMVAAMALALALSSFATVSALEPHGVLAYTCRWYTQKDTFTTEPGVRIHEWLGYCQDTNSSGANRNYQSGQDTREYDNGPYVYVSEMYIHVRAWQCGSKYADFSSDNYYIAHENYWTGWGPSGYQNCSPQADTYYKVVENGVFTWTNYLNY